MATYSINLYDRDGDIYEYGIFIHHKDSILKFSDIEELKEYINDLDHIAGEIKHYPI